MTAATSLSIHLNNYSGKPNLMSVLTASGWNNHSEAWNNWVECDDEAIISSFVSF